MYQKLRNSMRARLARDKRESAANSIGRVLESRDWGEDWPELGTARLRRRVETRADVTFQVGNDELVTRWRFLVR